MLQNERLSSNRQKRSLPFQPIFANFEITCTENMKVYVNNVKIFAYIKRAAKTEKCDKPMKNILIIFY